MDTEFYSNGKLLLTGEYAVLDGALALAVPTCYGQSLSVKEIDAPQLSWKSRDENGKVWFEAVFEPGMLSSDAPFPENSKIAETLLKILREAKKLNPHFLGDGRGYGDHKGFKVETQLTFPRDWGLGSSSTLINNIAQWAEVDAYALLWNAFSGSGYDIACARHNRPILYRIKKKSQPSESGTPTSPMAQVKEVDFDPSFQNQLYFVHLNKKQNSREGIAAYRKIDFDKPRPFQQISEITRKTLSCKSLSAFEALMTEHETLLSRILQVPTVKKTLFPDFKGAIKSLGTWGGDFVLATGDPATPSFFKELGYATVIPYADMVLKSGD